MGFNFILCAKAIVENLPKTLDEVKKIGYRQVEPYGFPSPQSIEMIERAKDLGMQVNSSNGTLHLGLFIKPPQKGHLTFRHQRNKKLCTSPTFRPISSMTASKITQNTKHNLTDLVVPYLQDENRLTQSVTFCKDLTAYKKTAEKLNQGAETSNVH